MMIKVLIYIMIYAGSALMGYNIYRYVRFAQTVRKQGNWSAERRIFNIPIVLLILFLIGYLVIGILGHPDIVMAGILFGGSIFVFVMLLLMQRTVAKIQENERLEAKLAAAEGASRSKTFFLSNMSHDIRTPLNAIIGYTTLANREGVTLEEKNGYINKIEKAGTQLLDIVNDVLEMSRIESGKMELEPVRINLCACVEEAGDLVKAQLAEKHIQFTSSCEVEHEWVLCDQHLLNRALMNLLCNAGKFTEEYGSVSLYLTEENAGDGRPAADPDQGHYVLRVVDTGIGMSPEFVENLFTPFERERTSTVSKIQGTGLGMAITKNIIDLMDGTIDVTTEQGKGTTFTISISLPIEEPEKEQAKAQDEIRFDGRRLLLAEDNVINLEIASMLLTQAGFTVEHAENGRKAVDMVATSEAGYYDLILMDIQMPIMDGYEATKKIRSLEDAELAGIPIIAMTANAFQDDVAAAQEAGMQGHIAKPLDVQKMIQTIQEVIDNN